MRQRQGKNTHVGLHLIVSGLCNYIWLSNCETNNIPILVVNICQEKELFVFRLCQIPLLQ